MRGGRQARRGEATDTAAARRRARAGIVATLIVVGLVVAEPVRAHNPTVSYIPARWDSPALLSGEAGVWVYMQSGNGLHIDHHERAKEAYNRWSDMNYMALRYEDKGYGDFPYSCATRPRNRNSIRWNQISDDAHTQSCLVWDGGQWDMNSFWINIDPDSDPWYTGASWDVPGNQSDWRSMVTHELGHGLGFGTGAIDHFTDAATCTDDINHDTMCLEHPYGESWWRSLSDHDNHTFSTRYP